MNSFWIELDGFFCQTKINFTKLGPLPTSKMDLFVTIVVIFRLQKRTAQMLTPWSMVRDPFSLLFQTQNKIRISMKLFQKLYSNMSMLLTFVRSAANFKLRILLVLFTQIINKDLRMNGSINLEFLIEMPQHFGRAKRRQKKKIDLLINWQFKNIIGF